MTAYRLPLTVKAWQTEAACAGDWDLFDCEDDDAQQFAKTICEGCPVKQLCLTSDAAKDDRWFVAGGKTYKERASRKADRGTFQHGTTSGYYKHKRDGEPTCQPCRDANTTAQREQSRKRDRERDRAGRIKGVQAPCQECGAACGAVYCRRCTQKRNMANNGNVARGNQRKAEAEALLAQGLDRTQIADRIGVSVHTAYRYLAVGKAS